MTVVCVDTVRAELGEGALWDAVREVVWWVDIRSSVVHCHEARTGLNHSQMLGCRLTALGLTHDDFLIACGDPGFLRLGVTPDLQLHISEIIAAPQERSGNRFNDGKVDTRGRFWAGTMDDDALGAFGTLYRLDSDRTIQIIRTGLHVPNGPCFLADGTVLSTDTHHRMITALELDQQGEVIAQREFAQFSAAQGSPDGMTVDEHDHIWVAFWDGWCIRRLSPQGKIVAEIALPVQRPTCPVFGGEDLSYLYLTSAATGLSTQALAGQPLAGSLLRLQPGVRGRPAARFTG